LTVDDEFRSVVHVMVAPVVVRLVTVMAEIVGAGVNVRKVELAEVVDWLELLADTTSKSYVVLCVRPVSVTE